MNDDTLHTETTPDLPLDTPASTDRAPCETTGFRGLWERIRHAMGDESCLPPASEPLRLPE